MHNMMIYKILPESEWTAALAVGAFQGSGIDMADGYIHFSTAAQMVETAAKHFTARPNLILVAVDDTVLGDALKYEVSRGGALFPHLFRPLSVSEAIWAKPLPLDENSVHIFPEEAR
jgi:uncharacterized protein (DUF952 family)